MYLGTQCFLTKTVDGGTFMQMRIVRGTKILTNAPGQTAAAFGLPMGTLGFRACCAAKPLTVLFALIVLVFATATLEAQTLAPTQLQEFNTAVLK